MARDDRITVEPRQNGGRTRRRRLTTWAAGLATCAVLSGLLAACTGGGDEQSPSGAGGSSEDSTNAPTVLARASAAAATATVAGDRKVGAADAMETTTSGGASGNEAGGASDTEAGGAVGDSVAARATGTGATDASPNGTAASNTGGASSSRGITATVAAGATQTVEALDILSPPQMFHEAEALADRGATDAAVAAYTRYAAAEPSMSDVAAMGIGNALFEAGRYAEAFVAFTRARDEAGDRDTEFLAALRRGNALLRSGTTSETLSAYDDAYARARGDEDRAQAWAGEIAAYVEAGRTDEAYALRERFVRELPGTTLALGALSRLDEAGIAVSLADRAAVAAGNGDHPTAARLYESALAGAPSPPGAWSVALARSLAASGNHARVVELADEFMSSRSDDGSAITLAWLRAKALSRQDLDRQAAVAYEDIASLWPYDDDAPDALHRRALILESLDGPAVGAAALDELRRTYPGYDGNLDALLRSALLYYMAGDLPLAAERWSAAADHGTPEHQAQAWYWLGRAAAQGGDNDLATRHWRSAVAADADGYYGLRAAEPLGERLAPPPDGTGDVRADVGAWLAAWHGDAPETWAQAQAAVAGSRGVQRASALLDLDRRSSAGRALRVVLAETGEPLALAALAIEAADMGVHEVAIAAAGQLLRASGSAGRATAPRAVWRLAYPDAYGDRVRAEAEQLGVPEALMFALMRQESRFDPTALSPAGARGLAQVMPGTGAGIASALGEIGFEVSDLLDPDTSVRYGVWYLDQQLDRYDGRTWVALSAYNGGPGNAQRWLDASGGDRDLFTEIIDYRETRRYVKLVEEQRAQYARLYDAADRLD